jgi:hypothetical protein
VKQESGGLLLLRRITPLPRRNAVYFCSGAYTGKPVVKVTALATPTGNQVKRLGFMVGQFTVPDDFDQMGSEEIERIFGGGE